MVGTADAIGTRLAPGLVLLAAILGGVALSVIGPVLAAIAVGLLAWAMLWALDRPSLIWQGLGGVLATVVPLAAVGPIAWVAATGGSGRQIGVVGLVTLGVALAGWGALELDRERAFRRVMHALIGGGLLLYAVILVGLLPIVIEVMIEEGALDIPGFGDVLRDLVTAGPFAGIALACFWVATVAWLLYRLGVGLVRLEVLDPDRLAALERLSLAWLFGLGTGFFGVVHMVDAVSTNGPAGAIPPTVAGILSSTTGSVALHRFLVRVLILLTLVNLLVYAAHWLRRNPSTRYVRAGIALMGGVLVVGMVWIARRVFRVHWTLLDGLRDAEAAQLERDPGALVEVAGVTIGTRVELFAAIVELIQFFGFQTLALSVIAIVIVVASFALVVFGWLRGRVSRTPRDPSPSQAGGQWMAAAGGLTVLMTVVGIIPILMVFDSGAAVMGWFGVMVLLLVFILAGYADLVGRSAGAPAATLALGAAATFGVAILVGLGPAHPAFAFGIASLAILAWDVGENGLSVRRHLPAGGSVLEGTHAVAGVVVAVVAVGAATGAQQIVHAPPFVRESSVVGLLVILVGVVLVALAYRA